MDLNSKNINVFIQNCIIVDIRIIRRFISSSAYFSDGVPYMFGLCFFVDSILIPVARLPSSSPSVET